MYQVLIDKVIGEDEWRAWFGEETEITDTDIRNLLAAFPENETELKITIDSPGGDPFTATTIFNIIRDFARNNPNVKINTYIQGMAASAASFIALAASSVNPEQNKVTIEDNSVFIIHNAWGVVVGNRHDMRQWADWAEKVDNTMAMIYQRKTGKTEAEIHEAMDSESWYFGKEILDFGFADIIETSAKEMGDQLSASVNKNAAIHSAKANLNKSRELIQSAYAKMNKTAAKRNYAAAAMAMEFDGVKTSDKVLQSCGTDNNEESKMTIEELKKNHPDVYAAAVADGEAAGVAKEQARVNRFLAMGEKSGCNKYALECIKSGANPSDDKIVDAFFDKGKASQALAAQRQDEEDIPNPAIPKNDKAANSKVMDDAFEAALNGGC